MYALFLMYMPLCSCLDNCLYSASHWDRNMTQSAALAARIAFAQIVSRIFSTTSMQSSMYHVRARCHQQRVWASQLCGFECSSVHRSQSYPYTKSNPSDVMCLPPLYRCFRPMLILYLKSSKASCVLGCENQLCSAPAGVV